MDKTEAMLQLQKIATESSHTVRDDIWQVQFEEILQADWNSRTLEDCAQHIEMLRKIISGQRDVNSFYAVNLTVNGVDYELPLSAGTLLCMSTAINALLRLPQ